MDYKQELGNLIKILQERDGSDIHFSKGSYPIIRVTRELAPVESVLLSGEDTLGFLSALVSEEDKQTFLREGEIDFAYAHNDGVRFRGNAFFQRGSISIALRLVPDYIPTFEELHLPPVLSSFTKKKQGLFLVVGPTGQGKTTSLASMIEEINRTRKEHILTIEDPIEYVFTEKQSIVNQREVGTDTKDFPAALQSMFRQDVNVIFIGEMRGYETMAAAVTAAETGHLVLSTLHTNDAAQTIDRILDTFPGNQQNQVRTQLAGSLLGIFSQRLIPRISGGLVPAYELLVNNNAVSNLIRDNRIQEINSIIETSSKSGMISKNACLANLVRSGDISIEDARRHASDPEILIGLI